MIRGKWFPQGSDIAEPLALRQAVFGAGPDRLDDEAQQVVVYDNDTPVGTARLWWQAGAFFLGDVGVLEAKRGLGFGDLLVRLALHKALTHHASQVRLDTPREMGPFFARYGFTPDPESSEGSTRLRMSIRADAILLDGCSACGGQCQDHDGGSAKA